MSVSSPVITGFREIAVGNATRPPPAVYSFQLSLADVGTRVVLPMGGRNQTTITIKESGNAWGSGIIAVKLSNDRDGLAASAHSSPLTFTNSNANTTYGIGNAVIVTNAAYLVLEVTTAEADVTLDITVFSYSSV